jgi:hypothetical protein
MTEDVYTTGGTCPPHHWLIEDDPYGKQRWSCHRCGLVRNEQRRLPEARRLPSASTWGRDEAVLIRSALD